MKSFIKKSLSLLLGGMLMCTAGALPAYANSALQEWQGSSQTGTVFSGKNNPIEVKKEVLTFNIPDYPGVGLALDEGYSSSVTAEYTFVNTSEETVTAKLLFPFGQFPGYIKSGGKLYSDTEAYAVTVNGEAIPKTLRYTFLRAGSRFDLERDLALVQEDAAKHDFYSPQMPVTGYTFKVSDVDFEDNDPVAAFDLPAKNPDTRLYPNAEGGVMELEGTDNIRASVYLTENGQEFTVYAFGAPLSESLAWKIYADGQLEDGTEIDGKVELQDVFVATLSDLAQQACPEGLDISKEDWYHAVVSMLDTMYEENDGAAVMGTNELRSVPLENSLMRWYEYELTLKPGEELTNTVTAPLYPTISHEYSPETYTYQYLLSPAKTWKAFGPLDIRVNADIHMIDSNLENWQEDDTGYALSLKGLPDSELSFTLCEEKEPSSVPYGGKHQILPSGGTDVDLSSGLFFAGIVIVGLLLLAGIIVAIVFICKHHKKKKQQ